MPNLFRLLLIAMMLLTSQALAAARGQTHIAGLAVLCVGEATITLHVDADGQPVEVVTICPDMALSLMQGVAHVTALPVQNAHVGMLGVTPFKAVAMVRDSVAWRVRDPPVSLA